MFVLKLTLSVSHGIIMGNAKAATLDMIWLTLNVLWQMEAIFQ